MVSVDGVVQVLMNNTDQSHVVFVSVFTAMLSLYIVVGHLLEENRWFNESITAILIGCISGTVILLVSKRSSSHILRFDENLFFIYLLPPIIFNAGFQVKKKRFFHNFATIMLFGVVGVFISSAIILTAIGTIFSSTIPSVLCSLVFGEGVVNDATSIVLFHLLHLSGIITVFFCGISMSHYAWHNVSENSRITTRHIFATMSFIAETFIFLYVSMDALDIEKWKMSKSSFKTVAGVSSTIIFLILIGRAAFIIKI